MMFFRLDYMNTSGEGGFPLRATDFLEIFRGGIFDFGAKGNLAVFFELGACQLALAAIFITTAVGHLGKILIPLQIV